MSGWVQIPGGDWSGCENKSDGSLFLSKHFPDKFMGSIATLIQNDLYFVHYSRC